MPMGLAIIGSDAKRFTSNPSATLKARRSVSGSFGGASELGPAAFAATDSNSVMAVAEARARSERRRRLDCMMFMGLLGSVGCGRRVSECVRGKHRASRKAVGIVILRYSEGSG